MGVNLDVKAIERGSRDMIQSCNVQAVRVVSRFGQLALQPRNLQGLGYSEVCLS